VGVAQPGCCNVAGGFLWQVKFAVEGRWVCLLRISGLSSSLTRVPIRGR
jgi:hypothetical protein